MRRKIVIRKTARRRKPYTDPPNWKMKFVPIFVVALSIIIWLGLQIVILLTVACIPGSSYLDPITGKNIFQSWATPIVLILPVVLTAIIVHAILGKRISFRKPPPSSDDDIEAFCSAHSEAASRSHLNTETRPYQLETGEMSVVDQMEGHQFEYWCAGLLRKQGFENVEVTKGSGDQGVDVLAEKGGVRYAVQCKCYSRDLGNTPVQEVEAGRIFYGCHVGAVMTNRYFTSGAKELAARTGTLLWDRDFLEHAIQT